jgi:hypothetical protein
VADEQRGIVGIGDSNLAKSAEKLAAFSAVLQLQAAGIVSSIRRVFGSTPDKSLGLAEAEAKHKKSPLQNGTQQLVEVVPKSST